MKKILLSGIMLLSLQANIYKSDNVYHKNNLVQTQLPILFKISTSYDILSTAISGDNSKIATATRNVVKVFNTKSEELEKSFSLSEIKQVKFSKDASRLYILTSNNLYIYNTKNYKQITAIKGVAFKYFTLNNDTSLLAVFDYNPDNTYIYDLKTGEKLASIHNRIGYNGSLAFSPNSKKIALESSNNKIYIYDTKGNLLTTSPALPNVAKIDWLDNKHILAVTYTYTNKERYNLYILNIKTGEIEQKVFNKKIEFDTATALNSNNILIGKNNTLDIFNLTLHKFIAEFTTKDSNKIQELDLSNNKQLLAITHEKDVKIYNTAKLLSKYNTNKTISTKSTLPAITTPPVPEVKIVEKKVVIEKKVYVDSHKNIKPTVEIFASQTTGYAPLKVTFKIIANDEDGKISSYYINFAGKEAMAKGNPTKSFNYTFENPGNYNIMVAVKDNKGAIATKKITIKVKEESFNDFKKGLIGN